jgi:ribose 5-phosphate isomerase B
MTQMLTAIGTDHGGFSLKTAIVDFRRKLGLQIDDFWTPSVTPVDFPDYSRAVSQAVLSGQAERGIDNDQ